MVLTYRIFLIPPLFVSVVIGYQLSFYFLYQYFKNRKEDIHLNKILLAYGLIFLMSLTGHFIRILNLYYYQGTSIIEYSIRAQYLWLVSSVIVFFIIISSKSFKKIINVVFPKIMIGLLLVPLCSSLIFPIDSFEIVFYFMTFIPIPAVYIFIFQLKLIKLSTGSIKRRLKYITVGAAFCILAFTFGSYIFGSLIFLQFFYLTQIMAIFLFIFGMMIILLGVYDFPAFLEFGWRENLIALLIVNRHNYDILYKYKFEGEAFVYRKIDSEDIELSDSETIFSKGIIGIEKVISQVTKTGEMNINKIRQGDLLILLDRCDDPISNVIIGLFIKREMESANYIRRQIKDKFQENFKDVLLNIESLSRFEGLFTSFDVFLSNILK